MKTQPFYNENIEYNLKLTSTERESSLNVNEVILSKIETFKKVSDSIFTKLTTNNKVNWTALIDPAYITISSKQINNIISETEKRNGTLFKYNYSYFEFIENSEDLVLLNYNLYYLDKNSGTTKNQLTTLFFNFSTLKIVGIEI